MSVAGRPVHATCFAVGVVIGTALLALPIARSGPGGATPLEAQVRELAPGTVASDHRADGEVDTEDRPDARALEPIAESANLRRVEWRTHPAWREDAKHADGYANEVVAKLQAAGIRAEADLRNEKINYKVREHSLAKVPLLLVVGKREADCEQVSVWLRSEDDLGAVALEKFIVPLPAGHP